MLLHVQPHTNKAKVMECTAPERSELTGHAQRLVILGRTLQASVACAKMDLVYSIAREP